MLKITVNPNFEPKSFLFDQETVVIGDGSPDSVDICFPAEGLHQNHIKILLKEDGYWVANQANDPFVTYNGQPFGKKRLQVGDLLQIRDHLLRIDQLTFRGQAPQPPLESGKEPEHSPLLAKYEDEPPSNFPDVDTLANDENPEAWFPSDIPQMQETAPAQSQPTDKPASTLHAPVSPHQGLKLSPLIEEAYNLEEQKPLRNTAHLKQDKKPVPAVSWRKRIFKIAALSLMLITALFGLILVEAYFRASGKSDHEEMMAGESLTDYAMAMTYAKVYHIAPQKQNWIDPQFIKNNLVDLMSTTSLPCGNIDSQGQFSCCSYYLRFYTNRDFSRFILLAQPLPTISQWLIPKNTLIVDSNLMDLRKTDDLKSLNRLLSNPNPLDDDNGDELTEVIKRASVIPLSVLAKGTGKREFAPPRALSYMKPGAENLIYNSPRYYHFGGTFLKKILMAVNHPQNTHEIAVLKSELDTLSKFHNLVFYSESGMQEAVDGYRALKKMAMPISFLTGYLIYAKDGNIVNSHLIIDNEPQVPLESADQEVVADAEGEVPSLASISDDGEIKIAEILQKHAEDARLALTPILHNIRTVLVDTLEKDSLYLPPTFFQLLDFYQQQKEKSRTAIEEALATIRLQSPETNEFFLDRLLREYGLMELYHSVPAVKGSKKAARGPATPLSSLDLKVKPSYSLIKHFEPNNILGTSKTDSHAKEKESDAAAKPSKTDLVQLARSRWDALQKLKIAASRNVASPPRILR